MEVVKIILIILTELKKRARKGEIIRLKYNYLHRTYNDIYE